MRNVKIKSHLRYEEGNEEQQIGQVAGEEQAHGQRDEQQNEGHGAEEDSDPELHEIDPSKVLMYHMGHDSLLGKTSEREKKMAEIDWGEVARKRREEVDRMIAEAQNLHCCDVKKLTQHLCKVPS